MRYILLIFGLLIGLSEVSAGGLHFESVVCDFGEIAEDGGDVRCEFKFSNTTQSSVVIYNIRTSCGCTEVEYSREPLVAGGDSSVGITFDPRYRPGVFEKDIYIYSTATKDPMVLKIVGRVTPRKMSLEEEYPFTIGSGGRIGALYMSVVGVRSGSMTQGVVGYVNSSRVPMKVDFRARGESDILKLYYDRRVEAGAKVLLEVGYDLSEGKELEGVVCDTIDIYVNGARSNKSIYVRGYPEGVEP